MAPPPSLLLGTKQQQQRNESPQTDHVVFFFFLHSLQLSTECVSTSYGKERFVDCCLGCSQDRFPFFLSFFLPFLLFDAAAVLLHIISSVDRRSPPPRYSLLPQYITAAVHAVVRCNEKNNKNPQIVLYYSSHHIERKVLESLKRDLVLTSVLCCRFLRGFYGFGVPNV